MPPKIKAKEHVTNMKCKYHLTKKFYFWKIILHIHSRAHKVIHYSFLCCSKRLEAIHVPIQWRLEYKLRCIYTLDYHPGLRRNEEDTLTWKDLQTVLLIEKCRVQNSMSNMSSLGYAWEGQKRSSLRRLRESWGTH